MIPSTKPVTRLTSAYVRDRGLRPIVITITGSIVELRAKGLRARETMDVAAIYSYALKARLAHEKALKRKARSKR